MSLHIISSILLSWQYIRNFVRFSQFLLRVWALFFSFLSRHFMSILLLMLCFCSFAPMPSRMIALLFVVVLDIFLSIADFFLFLFLQLSFHDINWISLCGIAAIDTTTFLWCIQMHWTKICVETISYFPVHQFFIILEALEMDIVTYRASNFSKQLPNKNRNIDNWEIEDYSLLCAMERNTLM